ncbi:MAG TPA: protein-disulfide reductase DsbD domain-containing protein [Aliidongia sp.]|nr:protein-disulfide reductase DsbD domain-containing protein [Aliidongia sp.]
MTFRLVTWLAFFALLFVRGAAAEELASDWGTTHQGQVRLIAAPGTDGALRLGLQFQLKPHWKIYWRAPGDAGLPPEIDWDGSTNIAIGATSWPAPERFSYAGLETFGYEGETVFPIAATMPDRAAPAEIKAAVDFLTCADICVPNHVVLALTIADGAGPGPWAGTIDQFAARVPGSAKDAGLAELGTTLGTEGKDLVLTVRLRATPPLGKPDLLVEGADGFSFGAPRFTVRDDAAELRLVDVGGAVNIGKLMGKTLDLTLIDRSSGLRAATFTVMPSPAPPASPLGTLLPILGVALLGGLILNFMPCVLPVLSMKLLALVGHAGMAPHQIRLGFLATGAGIVTSFLIIGTALIAARSAGLAIGWGVQFQEPVFLAALTAIITLFACNLFGWFEIALPSGLADFGARGGNFAGGVFATLLATPCSAPFLGTAVGFALAGSIIDIVAVFLCLGIGMALPYLAVSLFPGLARVLPRPGRWMLRLRQALGLLLAGTAAWLIGVMLLEAGPVAAWAVASLGLAAALCLALRRRPLGFVAAILLLAMLAPPALIRPQAATPVAIGSGWVPFDHQAIAASVAAGHVVFVDVTAGWCLTCQVNERLVLDTGPVQARLTAPGTIAMRADWTRRDALIGDYLKTYGRYGIPFNIVYGPAAPDGLPLPELLTQSAVLDALKQAKGTAS